MWQQPRGTPMSGDLITKVVRQNFKPMIHLSDPYLHEAVQCRTDTVCQKAKPEDYWMTNFTRRQANLHKGFKTIYTAPYAPIGGEIIMDPFELVCSTLPNNIENKAKLRIRRGTIVEEEEEVPVIQAVKSSSSEDNSLDDCKSAGYDDIKRLLHESEERFISVQGGTPYLEHLMKYQEKMSAAKYSHGQKDMGGTKMVLKAISSSCFVNHKEADAEPTLALPSVSQREQSQEGRSSTNTLNPPDSPALNAVPRMSDHFERANNMLNIVGNMKNLTLADPTKQNRPEYISSPTRTKPSPHKIQMMGTIGAISHSLHKKERILRDQLLFLDSLFSYLTVLHNLKLRDVKSKLPLSHDTIEKMKKEGYLNKEEERIMSRGVYSVLIPKVGKNAMIHDESSITVESDCPSMESANTRQNCFGMARKLNMNDVFSKLGNKKSNRVSMAQLEGRLETWEDLMATQPREEARSSHSPVAGAMGKIRMLRMAAPVPGIVVDEPDREYRDEPVQQQQTQERAKKLNIWQQVAQERSTVRPKKIICKKEKVDPKGILLRVKTNMANIKSAIEEENDTVLEKIERERVSNFRLKYSKLRAGQLSTLFEQQKHKIQDVRREKIDHTLLDNFEIVPSKWYEDLRAKSLVLTNVTSEQTRAVTDSLDKLLVYSHMDNRTISYAKAKLCLLMMSLPMYEICHIYAQKSLKLIFEEIMMGTESQFIEWLNVRKIPYILTPEVQKKKKEAFER